MFYQQGYGFYRENKSLSGRPVRLCGTFLWNSTACFNGEIIPRGIDKGRGMELVCRYYDAGLQDTIAFGDSMNDLEMMQAAGISVAMGNACQTLKDMADTVCEEVWKDGIYHEFCRLGLI